jgi:hypothetical protein
LEYAESIRQIVAYLMTVWDTGFYCIHIQELQWLYTNYNACACESLDSWKLAVADIKTEELAEKVDAKVRL